MSKSFLLFLVISLVFPAISFCQNQETQINTFSSRLSDPLKIEVTESERGTVVFRVRNDSWFTYHIELKFNRIENLSPSTDTYKDVVPPGTKTFFSLRILDLNSLHNYSYSFKYAIGDPGKTADENFEYLIPLANGKRIKLFGVKNNNNNTFLRNVFELENGDSIFCMRKGIVTSTYGKMQTDRINESSTVEVLHSDGTIALYNVTGEKKVLVVPGQIVYPQQPLVVIENPGNVQVSLFKLEQNNMLKSFVFKYEGDSGKDILNNSIVNHSAANIEKELSKKEEKRFGKGKLYE